MSKKGDLGGWTARAAAALSSPVSSSSKSEVFRKSKLSRALSTVRLRLDEELLWPGRRHCRGGERERRDRERVGEKEDMSTGVFKRGHEGRLGEATTTLGCKVGEKCLRYFFSFIVSHVKK